MRPITVSTAALAALLASSASLLVAQAPPYLARKVVPSLPDSIGCCSGIAEPKSGRFIVYENGTRGIQIANARTGNAVATISRSTAPILTKAMGSSLSLSASGHRLVFPAAGESSDKSYVWSVDLDSSSGAPMSAPHRVSISTGLQPAISNDGRWIAFVSSDAAENGARPLRKLVMMPSDGGEERVLDSAGNNQTPHWSADGNFIYYIRGRGHGPALTRIGATGGKPDSLAPAMWLIGLSADGQRLAFLPFQGDDRYPVRIADLTGRTIATVATTEFLLAWSGHEPATMYGRRGDWPTTFKVISLGDGKISPYSLNDRWASGARFSPDGRTLAAISRVGDLAQIIVYDPASNQRRVLRTTAEPANWSPDGPSTQWSPDGSHIAFLAYDSSFTRHDLYVVDIATSHAVRLADLGPQRWGDAVLFRWRSDGKSIDYISGTTARGATPSLERVTLGGMHSTITKLPAAPMGAATDGGYRLLNDTLIAIGRNPKFEGDSAYLAIVDSRTGAIRTMINRAAYWQLSDNSSVLSPDGKWIAFGTRGGKDDQTFSQWAIASLDGKTVRTIGEPTMTPCRKSNYFGAAAPHQWLPDSRSLIGSASPCDGKAQVYDVPIDGTPARHVTIPTDWAPDAIVMPDGRHLLAATITGGSNSIFAVDLAKALDTRATQTGKARKPGRN